jgi:hyaluronate lyase
MINVVGYLAVLFSAKIQARLVVAILTVVVCIAGKADEYDTLRLKWRDVLTGGSAYDVSDPDIASKITAITAQAQSNWDSMNKTAGRTYLWSDQASTTLSRDITVSYTRLKEMALAYCTKGSSLQNNTSLLNDVIGGLDWMYTNRYNENKIEYDNWYQWEIGTPIALNNCTVMLYDQLTATQRDNYMRAIDKFTPEPGMTGANLVWKVTVVAIRGIIVKDAAKIANARYKIGGVLNYVTSGNPDGFYRDGSFIQHLRYPYNGGYGLALISDIGNIVYLLNGSTWEVTDPDKQNIFKWVYDSYEPLLFKGSFMAMVRGREISRNAAQDHTAGAGAIRSILRISQLAPVSDAAKFKSMVKYWIQADTYKSVYLTSSIEMILLEKAIVNDVNVPSRGELVKYKQFPCMDRAVHLRPGFGFGISMSSSRIANYESINDENLRGWYTGDGMTYLYNNDLSQYDDNFWPTVDPKRLAGTTVDAGLSRGQNSGRGYVPPKNWVGGAEILGLYGVTGMELDAWSSTLTARKSWFMFDDEIVALGSGINSTDNRTIETIVENRKIMGNNALTVNGIAKTNALGWAEAMSGVSWVHLAGNVSREDIGYYFPTSTNLKGRREARTGKWADINYLFNDGATNHIRNYLTLWCDHGTNPKDATYSYVIIPNKTSAQIASYASAPDIAIVTNSVDAQAVKENRLNILGVNFWTDKMNTVDLITSDKKAAVMVKENAGTDIEVAVSDPTQLNTGVINLEITRKGVSLISTNAGIAVVQLNPTIKISVNVNAALGKTFKAKFAITSDSAVVDADLDGLPDVWEVAHFGSISDPRAKPLLDPDGDGFSNEAECSAGTSPISSGSRLSISEIIKSGTGMQIEWTSVAGKIYEIQTSADLMSWVTIDSRTASSSVSSWIDNSVAASARKFYRVKVQ